MCARAPYHTSLPAWPHPSPRHRGLLAKLTQDHPTPFSDIHKAQQGFESIKFIIDFKSRRFTCLVYKRRVQRKGPKKAPSLLSIVTFWQK